MHQKQFILVGAGPGDPELITLKAIKTLETILRLTKQAAKKFIDKVDEILEANGLLQTPISIRMTGCANGCGRPFLAEIAMVGRAPGRYNLYLGASFTGDRLNKLYKEMLNEEQILNELTPLLEDYAKSRETDEHFGDFVIRKGYIKATTAGINFHE